MSDTLNSDLMELTTLIDEMLSDVKSTNIVETSKVMDFLLDARIIASRIEKELTADVIPV